ncbi:hypothetical protein Gogos_001920 [Gossypium gossypioides]|uniref:Uncharacterized protein n=1 Tax=Gossypium gossypioides TaxID=34282 RepID=A0A7J9CPT3_GOSGO|nr:hypothetical protein [Gossypium gossypioides]
MVHERKITSGRDLSYKIQSYLLELEGVREKKLTFTSARTQGQGGESMREKYNLMQLLILEIPDRRQD